VIGTPTGSDRAVRRRPILLVAGLAAGVLGIAGVGAILYEYRKPAGLLPTPSSAKTVPVTTPGGGVDPRDAWRGLEGAAIEEIRRQLAQVTDDLKRIRREREQERSEDKQRTERETALAALAPPPSAATGRADIAGNPAAARARAGVVRALTQSARGHATRLAIPRARIACIVVGHLQSRPD
jgi:hypothetical protein